MADDDYIYPHVTDPETFKESLVYSEAKTGFTTSLIENDYFCSLVLYSFFSNETALVFKGGTCLSKAHVDFYRLSEDLDFIIPVSVDTRKAQRRAEMKNVKTIFDRLPEVIPGMEISGVLVGHNNSRQYIGYLGYQSAIIEKLVKIKVEIGLREPLLLPLEPQKASTLAVNPFTGLPLVPFFTVHSMALREMYAEKIRAAMTRKEPAIRDFFDLFHAVHTKGIDLFAEDFLDMVTAKLEVRGNGPVDLSSKRKYELDLQLEGQLKPVLRPRDYAQFDLDKAFELVCKVAAKLSL